MKQLKLIFLLTIFMSVVGARAFAYNAYIDGIYYYLDEDGMSASVTYLYYNSSNNQYVYTGDVIIPQSVNYKGKNYIVTTIGWYAFNHCVDLISITIPNSVGYIGRGAFDGCYGLQKVIVSDIASWCAIVFDGYGGGNACNPLSYACHLYNINGTEVTDLVIPNGVTSIGNHAFKGCAYLTTLTIPNSVMSIGDNAFEGCGLTSITIPQSVTTIGDNAFEGCNRLTSVKVPVNDYSAFCNNSFAGLISSRIGKPIYLIDNKGNEITEYVIPDDVTSIGDKAFYNCSGLTSITIPQSVTSIGNYAFAGCYNLSVKVPVNDYSAFCNNSFVGLISSRIGKPIYLIDNKGNEITEYVIPDDVTSIGDKAFYNCSGLTSITIPNSVTTIGDDAFSGCSGLTSINILNSVINIGAFAFKNCSSLTSITIPYSITNIGYSAFEGCCLSSVTFHCKEIGSWFSGLTSITKVVIGDEVTSIGSAAFRDCSGLPNITIPNNVTSIGEYNQEIKGKTNVEIIPVSA